MSNFLNFKAKMFAYDLKLFFIPLKIKTSV